MHGGGADETSENRLGVFLHYAPNWLRQEEKIPIMPSISKRFVSELRDLIGYSQGGYVLGFFTDPTDKGKLETVSKNYSARTLILLKSSHLKSL